MNGNRVIFGGRRRRRRGRGGRKEKKVLPVDFRRHGHFFSKRAVERGSSASRKLSLSLYHLRRSNISLRPAEPLQTSPGHARSGMASGSAAPRGEGGGGGGFNAPPPSSTNPTPTTVPPATAPAAPSLSPADVHVLLVDDERMQRMVVASLLRKCSYKGA